MTPPAKDAQRLAPDGRLGFVPLHDGAADRAKGRTIQTVTMTGLSGGFLARDDLDATLDDASIRPRGSFLEASGPLAVEGFLRYVPKVVEAQLSVPYEGQKVQTSQRWPTVWVTGPSFLISKESWLWHGVTGCATATAPGRLMPSGFGGAPAE